MSRNLGKTNCDYCGCDIKILEEPRLITKDEAGCYYDEYKELFVAIAECPACLARYIAWFKDGGIREYVGHNPKQFYDLSFRYSFNEEPNERDLPVYQVKSEIIYNRLGPFMDSAYMKLGKIDVDK